MKNSILYIAVFTALIGISGAQVVGTASLHLPAVILSNNTGSLTLVHLTVTKGNGTVEITQAGTVGNSTLQSAITGAQYAAKYLGLDFYTYNFNYSLDNETSGVNGPSGGTGMTLLAISALSGKPLLTNFTVTGTVNSSGYVGPIGGVYDKATAAKRAGLSYIIVPRVPPSSGYAELYLLVQQAQNIPLVQVGNISQAAKFAFGKANIEANASNFTFYRKFNLNIPPAPISCSNGCNMQMFQQLLQFTFGYANSTIGTVTLQRFAPAVAQFRSAIAQDSQIAAKGYLYAAGNQAFLTSVDAFFFSSYASTISSGLATLQSVYNYCDSLQPPYMTKSNYEFVLAGELRQSWGAYVMSADIATYNSSVETTDDVMFDMEDAGTANAWCSAAQEMYEIANQTQPQPYAPSSALSAVASSRIGRAEQYGLNTYLGSAEVALQANNYPLAILDADYAYAINNASEQGNQSTQQLIAMANKLAYNSTYGVWATQFSNEAEFFVAQAQSVNNQTDAHSYAEQAYSAAFLASQISNDTSLIYGALMPGKSPQSIGTITPSTPPPTMINSTTQGSMNQLLSSQLNAIYDIVIVLIVIVVVMFAYVLYHMVPMIKHTKEHMAMEHGAEQQKQKPRRSK